MKNDLMNKAVEISKTSSTQTGSIGEFFGKLFQLRDVAHLNHLKSQSYAQHVALGDFYDGLLTLTDDLIECYQGIKGIVDISIPASKASDPTLSLQEFYTYFQNNRSKFFTESQLLNISDEILSLINKTIYKLKNLK